MALLHPMAAYVILITLVLILIISDIVTYICKSTTPTVFMEFICEEKRSVWRSLS